MQFIWPEAEIETIEMVCPVCNHSGDHPLALTIPGQGPVGRDWRVLKCPACQSLFSTDRHGADYGMDDALLVGEHDTLLIQMHVEQGAGLRMMLDPLGFAEPGSHRFLEIGGGFGFASDYMRTVLGWTAKGYDPSGMAVIGQRHLGLDIVRGYWTSDTPLEQAFDVAYASEVIEHIADPLPFLQAMRHAVGDTGIIVLTTPNGALINPGTTPGMLVPFVSPCLHLTLFSAKGMEIALRATGFTQVRVEEMGTQVVAFASNGPLPQSWRLPAYRYIEYLQRRIDSPNLSPSLLSGLRYRLFKEQVNTGELDKALQTFNDLRQSTLERYSVDIDDPQSITIPSTLNFQEWLSVLPVNIVGLLFFRAVLANNAQSDPRMAAIVAGHAVLLAASLRRVLRAVAIDDAETESMSQEALKLHLTASIGIGADAAPLLAAVEHGNEEEGLLLSSGFRVTLRQAVAKDLRAMRHPSLLWKALIQVNDLVMDEVEILRSGLEAGLPSAPDPAFAAIAKATDVASVKAAVWAIWSTPGAGEAMPTVKHARKLALIRLVQLGAFREAVTLFDAWEDPSLADDEPVSTALGIAASAI